MPLTILFAAKPASWAAYQPHLETALADAGIDAHLTTDAVPADVDYIIYAPNSPVQDFTPYTRAKAVLNLWAGVENVVGNETLKIPLARMVDPGLTRGMAEWVTGHVMRYHLGMDRHIVNPDHAWEPHTPPLAHERSVVILGLGALGTACAQMLLGLGFRVTGWSRSPKNVAGVTCLYGADGLATALSAAQICVTLLPNTPATENLLDGDRLNQMPQGAYLINPGRGTLIDDAALLAAIESGRINHATLDVFRIEPLPKDHPFWASPFITVTPHIAAETRPSTASRVIVENIRRGEAGMDFLHLVDRQLGY